MTAGTSHAADCALETSLRASVSKHTADVLEAVHRALHHPLGLAEVIVMFGTARRGMPPAFVAPRERVVAAMRARGWDGDVLRVCEKPAPEGHVRCVVYAPESESEGVVGCQDVPIEEVIRLVLTEMVRSAP